MGTRTRWTLADIRHANSEAGGYFFRRDTMRAFGDTMRSYRVEHDGDRVFLVRVRPMRNSRGVNMGGVGDRSEFNRATGWIGPVIREWDH